MVWLYIGIIITLTTAMWPIGRWGMAGDGQGTILGFWISITATLVFGVLLLVQGSTIQAPPVWLAGGVLGVAFSLGFCVLIMGSLRIGPMSLTTTMNNLAMVWGVLYSLFWLHTTVPTLFLFFGIAGVCIAMLLIGFGGSKGSVVTGIQNRKWLLMVLGGSALSGLSFIAQTYVGTWYAEYGILFAFAGYLVSTLILSLLRWVGPRRRAGRRECLAGAIIGTSISLSLPLVLVSIHRIGADIVLPVTLVSPMILILLLSHFIYGERLGRIGVAACLVGAVSVGLLAYSNRG